MVFNIIISIIGLLFMVKPKIIWNMQHFMTVEGGNPTELAIVLIRFSGLLLVIMSLAKIFG